MKNPVCFTIGHSRHKIEGFISLLELYSLKYVFDVRSIPYSRHNPQFNRESLIDSLRRCHINYIFTGDLLGAKYDDPELFFPDIQVVDFRKVRGLSRFIEGIDKIKDYVNRNRRVVLMCAEKDPLNCHRFSLISYVLVRQGINPAHITDTGELISNNELEDKLIARYKLDDKQQTLFSGPDSGNEILEQAYVLKNRELAGRGNLYGGSGRLKGKI